MNGRIKLVALIVALGISISAIVKAQNTSAAPKKPASGKTAPSLSSQSPSAEAWSEVERRLDSIDQTLKRPDVDSRLDAIEKAIVDLKHSSILSTLLPAIIAAGAAVVGLFIGGFVNDRLQRTRLIQEERIASDKAVHEKGLAEAKANQERELAERQSKLQIGNAVVDWELKQLYLLYGPIRALLGQSFGLYRQMNILLQRADGERFRFFQDKDAKGQNAEFGEVFQIHISAEWMRFRTVLHIDQVYGKGFGVETYFDEIVSIGERIVKIIEQHAGYARPEEEQLMAVFAKYLAHQAVLKHLLEREKTDLASSQSPRRNLIRAAPHQQFKVDLSAVFPVELHDLISQGFDAISKDIEKWRAKALA